MQKIWDQIPGSLIAPEQVWSSHVNVTSGCDVITGIITITTTIIMVITITTITRTIIILFFGCLLHPTSTTGGFVPQRHLTKSRGTVVPVKGVPLVSQRQGDW